MGDYTMSLSFKNLSKALVALSIAAGLSSPILLAPSRKAASSKTAALTPVDDALAARIARIDADLAVRMAREQQTAEPLIIRSAVARPTTVATPAQKNPFQKTNYFADELVIEFPFDEWVVRFNCGNGSSGDINKPLSPVEVTVKKSDQADFSSWTEARSSRTSLMDVFSAFASDLAKSFPLLKEAIPLLTEAAKGSLKDTLPEGANLCLRVMCILNANLDAGSMMTEIITLLNRYKLSLKYGKKESSRLGKLAQLVSESIFKTEDELKQTRAALVKSNHQWIWDFMMEEHKIELTKEEEKTIKSPDTDISEKLPIAVKLVFKAVFNVLNDVAVRHATLLAEKLEGGAPNPHFNSDYRKRYVDERNRKLQTLQALATEEGQVFKGEVEAKINSLEQELNEKKLSLQGQATNAASNAELEKIIQLRNLLLAFYMKKSKALAEAKPAASPTHSAYNETRLEEARKQLFQLNKDLDKAEDDSRMVTLLERIGETESLINDLEESLRPTSETDHLNDAGRQLLRAQCTALANRIRQENSFLNNVLRRYKTKAEVTSAEKEQALEITLKNRFPSLSHESVLQNPLAKIEEQLNDPLFKEVKEKFNKALKDAFKLTKCDETLSVNIGLNYIKDNYATYFLASR